MQIYQDPMYKKNERIKNLQKMKSIRKGLLYKELEKCKKEENH